MVRDQLTAIGEGREARFIPPAQPPADPEAASRARAEVQGRATEFGRLTAERQGALQSAHTQAMERWTADARERDLRVMQEEMTRLDQREKEVERHPAGSAARTVGLETIRKQRSWLTQQIARTRGHKEAAAQ